MAMLNLSKEVRVLNMNSSVGSSQGTTSFLVANIIDTAGFNSVMLIATLGAVTATAQATMVPMWGSSSGACTASSGTTSTVAGVLSMTTEYANTLLVADYINPGKRWLGVQFDKGTAATAILSCSALLYNKFAYQPTTSPVLNSTGFSGSSGSGQYWPSSVIIAQSST